MADVILRKESTLELYEKAGISAGTVNNCEPYNPLGITRSFQIATYQVKLQYRGTFNSNSNNIVWDWKVVGNPTITKLDNLSPTIKSHYDTNKNAPSPDMSNELNTEIQSQLMEHEIAKESLIINQIKAYYNYSSNLPYRTTPGANELIAIFAAKRAMRSTPFTYESITITGKIFIKPQIITTARKEDFAQMSYTSGSGKTTASCATAQILLSEQINNFKFTADNVVESENDLDMTPYDYYDTWAEGVLTELTSTAASLQNEFNSRKNKQLTLMQQYSETIGNYNRYVQWLREWQNNQRTTIQKVDDGFIKFGMSGAVQGVINVQLIVPFGEGGLYWNSAVVQLNLNVNQLTQEIGFWQQYAARVREFENNRALALKAYLASLKDIPIPPETPGTEMNLLPLEDFGTLLPGNPEVNQSVRAPGEGRQDGALINLEVAPDLSPFYPGPDIPFIDQLIPPPNYNDFVNGFFFD